METALQQVVDTLAAAAVTAVGLGVSAFLAWLASWLRARFQINLDESRNKAITEAVTNAAGDIINQLGDKAVSTVVRTTDDMVRAGIGYVHKTVPDAIQHFDMADDLIAEKIVAMVGRLTAPAVRSDKG